MKEIRFSVQQLLAASAISLASIVLSGCNTTTAKAPVDIENQLHPQLSATEVNAPDKLSPTPAMQNLASAYAAVEDEGFSIPAVPYQKINPAYRRQEVDSPYNEKAGTVVVDTASRFLYLIEPNGRAMRYGVGIGREGFAWTGNGVIQWKQTWPHWFPPKEMIARQPQLAKFSAKNGGMSPGLNNALGSRAMYIFHDGKDTLYRLHGTQEWNTIGKAVSSGCVRILNQDVIDLYNRVRPGAVIKVI
jgi:lipoprotein-anchoring transpeptidase ErfK/SrfK